MQAIEKRIAALESQGSAANANLTVMLVAVNEGETEVEAMACAG